MIDNFLFAIFRLDFPAACSWRHCPVNREGRPGLKRELILACTFVPSESIQPNKRATSYRLAGQSRHDHVIQLLELRGPESVTSDGNCTPRCRHHAATVLAAADCVPLPRNVQLFKFGLSASPRNRAIPQVPRRY